jgi:hypothetical protein
VDERFLTPVIDFSPTHTFATALLLLVVALACTTLTGGPRDPGTWVALTLSMLVLSGAKATFVPMLLAGFLAVIAVKALRRSWSWPAGALLLLTIGVFAFAQLVIFGGESQGMAVEPGHLVRAAASRVGLGTGTTGMAMVLAAALVAWLVVPGAGVVGLMVHARWRDDRAVFLAGVVVSGVGAAMTFGHSHFSEAYFERSTPVPTAVLSAWGLALLIGERGRGTWKALCGAGVAGAVMVGVVELFTSQAPSDGSHRAESPFQSLVLPYICVAIGVAAVALAVGMVGRHGSRTPGVVLAAAVACLLGLSLGRQAHVVADMARPADPFVPPHPPAVMVGRGGFAAAAWLRDHSAVEDLVATNAHQRTPRGGDNRAFWVAGETERHVLVEGWGYSTRVLSASRATGVKDTRVDFWDPALLAENDAAFTDPSSTSIETLEQRRGVHWLFVDTRFPSKPRAMEKFADLRFRAGDYWVFETRGG